MSKYRVVEVETIDLTQEGEEVPFVSITRRTVFNTENWQALVDFIDKQYHQRPVPDTITYRVYEGSRRLHDFGR